MFDFARISVAVPKVSVGSVDKNKQDIVSKIKNADTAGTDFILFPELSLTGCTCGDMLFSETLIQNVTSALNEIAELSAQVKSVIIIGTPLNIEDSLFNCAVVISAGRICAIIPKSFPNPAETRWFAPASELDIQEIMSEDIGIFPSYKIPVSAKLVIDGKGVRFGVEIGADSFAPIPVSAYLAENGAEIIFNPSAAYLTVRSTERIRDYARVQSERLHAIYAVCCAGSDESTTDYVFGGKGLVAENGKLLVENKKLTDSDYIMNCDTDLGKIRADRARTKRVKSCDGCAKAKLYTGAGSTKLNSDGSLYVLKKLPFVPTDKAIRDERTEYIFEMQTAALAKRLTVAGDKVVIGVSGGLDSTLALLVCVNAMKRLHRPVSNVVGITLPCFGTTSRTYNNALALMKALGVTVMEINIKEACLQHFKDIGHDYDTKDVTFENVQARERTQVLMDVANKMGAVVCGTGDLSELALGWCTYNADHMSMYGVNAGIPKTLIRFMLESLAETQSFSVCKDILKDIADTPISPELLPPDETGSIAQKTEDSVGPYALHDFFIYYTLRYGFTPEKVYELALRAFAGDFDGETVKKWLKVFYRRFYTQQFKRSCLPDGVKIGSVGISPRGDLVLPSDGSFLDFLARVDKL